jgi:pyrimidine operon attenuation protein/uracil phosphoribosyltransferase
VPRANLSPHITGSSRTSASCWKARRGAFLYAQKVMDESDIGRALARMAHEILERGPGAADLVLIGIHTRGVPLAGRLASLVESFEGVTVDVGSLEIGLYRDDLNSRVTKPLHPTQIPVDLDGRRVVLVDDVIYTGRSIRAALDGVLEFGRPRLIQVAALVDRGHRELPIRSDYIGRNLPTSRHELVQVHLMEVDALDEVVIARGASDE